MAFTYKQPNLVLTCHLLKMLNLEPFLWGYGNLPFGQVSPWVAIFGQLTQILLLSTQSR